MIVDTCLPVDTTKDHLACLERHLLLWKDGNILTLLEEGNIVQQSLPLHGGGTLLEFLLDLCFKGK